MKKKLILVLSLIALMVCLLAISVSAVEVDGIYYTLNNSGETPVAEVSTENRASCKLETVSIPATITVGGDTYKVTSIDKAAFKNCKSLKKLTIGKNVTTIGAKAFFKCKKLKSITFKGTKLKKVGKRAFKGIYKKVKIRAPKSKLNKYRKYFRK